MSSRYREVYAAWKRDPDGFWGEAARAIDWYKPWDKVFDPYAGQYGRWFAGAECNTAWNCLDRHVERGRAAQKALIYDSPVTRLAEELHLRASCTDEVATLGGVLQDLGVKQGDRVILYMPMIPEAVIGMLACARIGAIHSVVFGGFAAPELATRIDDAKPVAMLSASCGIEPGRIVQYKPLLDAAIDLSKHKPAAVLMLQRPMAEASMIAGRDHDWAAAIADAKAARPQGRLRVGKGHRPALHPLHIRHHGPAQGRGARQRRAHGGARLDHEEPLRHRPRRGLLGRLRRGLGRGPLLHLLRAAAARLHLDPVRGQARRHARPRRLLACHIAEHKVAAMFTAPTAFRAIKKEDPKGEHIRRYDLSRFRTLFLAGERADPETIKWAEANLKVPVYDHWWQTETGWPICGNPVGLGVLPVKYGSPTVPMPGYDLQVLDEAGKPVAQGQTGTLAVKLPLPPSCLPTLWENDEGFRNSYLAEFPGYYTTKDAGHLDADGYAFVMARTDDVINVAGHRLSTGQMEEIVARHRDVAECAVVGVADAMKGQIPAGFIVLNAGVNRPPAEIEGEVVKLVREEIGPVAAFKTVMTVKRLPKTRSGKILRGTMRQIADGGDVEDAGHHRRPRHPR